MLIKKLINQLREQIRLARMQRLIRQAEIDRIRDRHHRRHDKSKDLIDSNPQQ